MYSRNSERENKTSKSFLQHHNAVKGSSSSLCVIINSCDNQRCHILPFIANARAEEGEDPLWKQTPGEGVDMRPGLRVKERHGPLLIICKHPDNLRLFLERKTDWGGVQGAILVTAPQPHCPIAVLWLGGDHPLPVDRLFDHAQIPEGLCPHCNLIDNAREFTKCVCYL